MKAYIKPCMVAEDASMTVMLAASLPIGEGTVDGDDALVKNDGWDIFANEEPNEE